MSRKTDKSIEDTGERMVPAYHKGKLVYGEHIVRYEAARQLVAGKTALDIASGSGYGTALLGESAAKMYGVDVDADAIAYAQKNYGSKNIEFLKGDGKDIPLADNSVEVVVSFETIEHIEDYRHFMAEVKRVLTDDGLFILSTPNDVEFPEGAHFHIHEFERKELQKLVAQYFKQTKEYFQATWLFNGLMDEQQLGSEWLSSLPTQNVAPVKSDKAIYFYMLCANRKITEAVEPLGAISEHWSERKTLEHNAEIDKYIRDTIKHYEDILAAKDKLFLEHYAKHEELQKAHDTLRSEHAAVKNSRSWRAIQRMRAAGSKLKGSS